MDPMDTVIGIGGLALYILSILLISALITLAVIKISPSQSAKGKKQEEQETS